LSKHNFASSFGFSDPLPILSKTYEIDIVSNEVDWEQGGQRPTAGTGLHVMKSILRSKMVVIAISWCLLNCTKVDRVSRDAHLHTEVSDIVDIEVSRELP
jgi:hypothetical protein